MQKPMEKRQCVKRGKGQSRRNIKEKEGKAMKSLRHKDVKPKTNLGCHFPLSVLVITLNYLRHVLK